MTTTTKTTTKTAAPAPAEESTGEFQTWEELQAGFRAEIAEGYYDEWLVWVFEAAADRLVSFPEVVTGDVDSDEPWVQNLVDLLATDTRIGRGLRRLIEVSDQQHKQAGAAVIDEGTTVVQRKQAHRPAVGKVAIGGSQKGTGKRAIRRPRKG